MRRFAAIAAISGLVLASCGSSSSRSLQFGIQRLALDLAFVDEDAAPPLAPEIIVNLIPAPPQVQVPEFDFETVRVRPELPPPELPPLEFEPFNPCPSAPPEATVELTASPSIIDPPVPGNYLRDNDGFIELVQPGIPLRFPYPFVTVWRISESEEVARPGPLGTPGTTAQQFTVTKNLGTISIEETFEVGAEALLLIQRTTTANGESTTFRTDPPLEFFRYGAEGDSWNSAGADVENGFGVLIQGAINDRLVIDVCGTLVDTFVVQYTEQVVDLETSNTSGTDPDEPSFIYIAPQFGGLIIREEMHSSQRITDGDSSAVVNFDYVSTMLSVDPS